MFIAFNYVLVLQLFIMGIFLNVIHRSQSHAHLVHQTCVSSKLHSRVAFLSNRWKVKSKTKVMFSRNWKFTKVVPYMAMAVCVYENNSLSVSYKLYTKFKYIRNICFNILMKISSSMACQPLQYSQQLKYIIIMLNNCSLKRIYVHKNEYLFIKRNICL